MWKLVPDERYVSDPAKGSRHNRGAAVDVALVDQRGRALPMPSAYDEFTERSHRDFAGGSDARAIEARANRAQWLSLDARLERRFGSAPQQNYGYASVIHVKLLPGSAPAPQGRKVKP